jgi:hypothetical protein
MAEPDDAELERKRHIQEVFDECGGHGPSSSSFFSGVGDGFLVRGQAPGAASRDELTAARVDTAERIASVRVNAAERIASVRVNARVDAVARIADVKVSAAQRKDHFRAQLWETKAEAAERIAAARVAARTAARLVLEAKVAAADRAADRAAERIASTAAARAAELAAKRIAVAVARAERLERIASAATEKAEARELRRLGTRHPRVRACAHCGGTTPRLAKHASYHPLCWQAHSAAAALARLAGQDGLE